MMNDVCCPWKFQELWLVNTVHAGYPSCALIGQHKLGNTKPVLWQCGLLHVYTNWYRGWIYCTTVKRFQAQCVHPEYPVAVRILQGVITACPCCNLSGLFGSGITATRIEKIVPTKPWACCHSVDRQLVWKFISVNSTSQLTSPSRAVLQWQTTSQVSSSRPSPSTASRSPPCA